MQLASGSTAPTPCATRIDAAGRYFYKRKPMKPQNAQALDADIARRFWDRSEQLLGPLTPTGGDTTLPRKRL